jgi:hypothetical protein
VATSMILHDNFLVSFNPTVSFAVSGGSVANANASISSPQPVKQGYATGTPSGTYSAIVDKLYRVEIHVKGTGAFGSAQWRWTDNAAVPYNDIVWNASNLTTQNGVNVALNNGVLWRFDQVGAFTPQFETSDYWLFQVSLKYGYQKGLDDTRDHEYRSGAFSGTQTIEQRYDFGISVLPTAFVLLDHNIPSNATISLKSKSTGFTDPPDFTIPISWASGKIATLLSTSTRRYWRICVTLGGTAPTQGYLRWSKVFLGSSLTFNRTFQDFHDASEWLGAVDVETLRRGPGPRQLEGRYLRLTYGNMDVADQARLRTLRTWINDPAYNVQRPFYFIPFDNDLTNFILCHWVNGLIKDHEFLDRYSDPLELSEVIRSIA